MIYVTHSLVYNAVAFFIDCPEWLSNLTLVIITGIYVYILIKYPVRIEIHLAGKEIIDFKNRGNH